VNEKLASEAFRVDDEAARTIRSQSDDFTNDPVPRDFNRRKMALRVEGERASRCYQRGARRYRAPQKSAPLDQCLHSLRRLRRFTVLCNLRNL